tara:strand:+ start:1344 stop:2066 length:723 start_codon:yes stop_codon:yes gene_type:complete
VSKDPIFKFKKFEIDQSHCLMKVGTDGILLGAWCDVQGAKKVLDIGTGTGLVALMITQRTKNTMIMAVEVDQESSHQAKMNFDTSMWHDRLDLYKGTIQDFAHQGTSQFDHIVCNPPFFSGGTLSTNQDKNNVRHTIKLSHQDLLKSVRTLISTNGKFSLILPLIEGLRFIELAETYGLNCERKTEVKSRIKGNVERLLLQFSKVQSKGLKEDELIIYKSDSKDYTNDFIELTKDFYLKM